MPDGGVADYTYGNKARVVEKTGALGRLTTFLQSTGCGEQQAYDKAGNRIEKMLSNKIYFTSSPATRVTPSEIL